ncbi:adhesion G-protein coupled receptor G2-like isoform X2 [Halichondria panicea]|uniref:adhesion G-protein coupled receptor G2-like isoform X2 n=1 Tax=Halichondria panicea TaxID=6063 RepID=UPI00312B9E85
MVTVGVRSLETVSIKIICESAVYDVHAGIVEIPTCDVTGNSQLYFSVIEEHPTTSRRSLTLLDVYVMGECPSVDLVTGVCDTSGCDVDTTVCSLGSINCTGCNIGYQLLAKTTIGACHGVVLDPVFDRNVTEDNYADIAAEISSFSTDSLDNATLQTTELLKNISKVFNDIAELVKLLPSSSDIHPLVVERMASTLNSLIQWNHRLLEVESTSIILQSYELVASLYAQQRNYTLILDEVTIVTEVRETNEFRRTGSMFDFTNSTDVTSTISLPRQLFDNIPSSWPAVGILYTLYENPTLFPIRNDDNENSSTLRSTVATPVLAATVGSSLNFAEIHPPIVITLIPKEQSENITIREGSEKCVSWDFSSNRWVTDGCVTVRNETTNVVECQCTHLTNFAVLIDICSRAQDCENDPLADIILSATTYAGVVLSCIGIIFTVITLVAFKDLRSRDNTKHHIQLCIAIFCLLVVFVAGIDQTKPYAGCVVVSVLIHYFSLVAVMWMGAEAVLIFKKIVIIFGEITTSYIIVVSLICWLIPLIPVLLVLIIDMANGTDTKSDLIVNRYEHGVESVTGFCFLKDSGVFFGAFLAPILMVLLLNVVIFIWVTVIVVRSTKDKLKRTNEDLSSRVVIRIIISLLGITSLFGITWLFAALTITISGNNVLRTIVQALFVVSGTFQGFFLFLFFCVLDQKARGAWREAFVSCMQITKQSYRRDSSSLIGVSSKKTDTFTFDQNSNYSTDMKKEDMKNNFSKLKYDSVNGNASTDLNEYHKTRVIITVVEDHGTA